MIQKFDDADLGYVIQRRVLKAEYNELVKERKENDRNRQVKPISGGVDIIVKLDKPSYSFKGGESRAHSYEFGYRGENNQIRRMDKESADGRGRLGRNRSGDSSSGGTYQSRADLKVSQEELSEFVEFMGEVSAHMGELLMGSEAFIDAIVAKDGNLAQKAVAKIKSLKAMFERLGNAEASAEYKFLKKAEDLYLKAAEKAGDARLVRYITSGEWDEDEAEFNRKDIKSNNGQRKKQQTSEYESKQVLVRSESGGWRDISLPVDRGGARVLSEIVGGGEKELKKINNFATEFYTTPKNADQSYLKKIAQ